MSLLFNAGLLPVIYCLGFLLAFSLNQKMWQIAKGTAALGLAATVIALGSAPLAPATVNIDTLGLTMALLIAFLGWVIINYSFRYIQGEPGQPRFVKAMLFVLACVSLLVLSRNLAVIIIAWSGSSIGLHYLLTFYQERKTAQIVAHKKFIISRLADACLIVALLLVYSSVGDFNLDAITTYVSGIETLPVTLNIAALLIASAAIIKSAQLPLHGWLIQVMEAPTPVSALLHAGVVNIGGFVLIRLAELLSLAPAAQTLLVVVGSVTAVLAGLVMMTRISIKVRLAWSTCAQMGFMLMEVGLGLYELALLHLVAHSLYKAHAFLSAGDAVANTKAHDFFTPTEKPNSAVWYVISPLLSTATLLATIALWQQVMPSLNLPLAAIVIVALGFAPLLWMEQGASTKALIQGLIKVLALSQLYLAWHLLFAGLTPPIANTSLALLVWILASFGVLYVAQIWVRHAPTGRFAQALYPWAYSGFYLDETFTRLTLKFWPVQLSPTQAQTSVNRHTTKVGEKV